MKSALYAAAALLLVSTVIVLVGGAHPTGPSRQDLAEEVASLKARVEKAEAETMALTLELKTQRALLTEAFAFFRALPKACDALDQKMNDARTNGFEKAGPNPTSKTDVLDGIKSFCASLKAANPARKTEDVADSEK